MAATANVVRSRLASQLDRFSLEALRRIARTLSLSVPAKGRASYINALSTFISTPDHRARLQKHLDAQDLALLNLLPLRSGPFRLRILLVALRGAGDAPRRALEKVSRLLAHGCFISANRLYGDQRLAIDPQALQRLGADLWLDLALLEADDQRRLDLWLSNSRPSALLGTRTGPTTVIVESSRVDNVAQFVEPLSKECRVVDCSQPRPGVLEVRDPDLIAIRSDTSDPYPCYRVKAFASVVEGGAGGTLYRIRPETTKRAAGDGWNPLQLDQYLVAAGGSPLPEDFYVRLLGVVPFFGRSKQGRPHR